MMEREDFKAKLLMEISRLLEGRMVVSEEEVEVIFYRAIIRTFEGFSAKINPDSGIITEVKESLFHAPHSINSPHFSDLIEIAGNKFYHIHTWKPDKGELEHAYRMLLRSKRLLASIPEMTAITDRFFNGYSPVNGIIREYVNSTGKNYGVFYSTIEEVEEDLESHLEISKDYGGRYSVIVLTEKNPKHFIKFFKKHSEDAKKAGLRIWVADTNKKTLDPFIGYPKDLKLLKNFKNPRLASIISSLWRVDVNRIDD
jgi:hypothetical protein